MIPLQMNYLIPYQLINIIILIITQIQAQLIHFSLSIQQMIHCLEHSTHQPILLQAVLFAKGQPI